MGFGATLRPTAHRFSTDDGRTIYGFCASDALTYPGILDRPGSIESTCPSTGRQVRVEVTPGRVVTADPATTVVSRIRPAAAVADVRAEICALGNFFASAPVLPSTEGEPSAVEEEFFGPEVARMYLPSGGTGPLRSRMWPAFDVATDDLVVEKTARSAFFPGRCSLSELLAERGVDTVLITGVVANVCCESSARDASTLGYRVVMVADANAAMRDQDLNATLHTVYRSFGDVRPTDEVLELIRRG